MDAGVYSHGIAQREVSAIRTECTAMVFFSPVKYALYRSLSGFGDTGQIE